MENVQNSIIILKLCLLKNQIHSENFKYCKERREAENWQTDNQSKAWIQTWKIELFSITTFLPSCLTGNITRINSVIHFKQNKLHQS